MKIDGGLPHSLADRESAARGAGLAASVGYDRLFAAEAAHDPFLPVALAAGAADVDLGTNVAVAFARNPMTTAMVANDLQVLTGGRFILGLGSQVKAHITRRFSMPWSHPAARMREFVLALQAIWESWQPGGRLRFEGTFYRHTLSNPLFQPGPNPFGPPRVFLAAVGPRMTEVAGEVADGLMCHAFTSPSYLAEVTLPALRRGLARAGRADGAVEVCLPVLLATGPAGADLEPEIDRVRRQVAFYASTPAYRAVLDHHGWGDLHGEAHRLSVDQRWEEMAGLVDDDILHTLAVVADAGSLADVVRDRFGRLVTGLRLNVPYADDPEAWAPVIEKLKQPVEEAVG
ncbi:F420-dependent oxidoreductase [Frankia sp. R43]|uniref:TIGR03617 family F420-dependent LLM class oxidoreductase n=1 Tax=Frankia sp. R43 TaxID=269536 RepID=UPI0006CA0EDF|nr:TIGR03617 family F420-dependent LLM class oxidoreductase [Frankia sp. R43]KPM56898.1 F420-dependent oxidoreductase [Frankia sp. R43]